MTKIAKNGGQKSSTGRREPAGNVMLRGEKGQKHGFQESAPVKGKRNDLPHLIYNQLVTIQIAQEVGEFHWSGGRGKRTQREKESAAELSNSLKKKRSKTGGKKPVDRPRIKKEDPKCKYGLIKRNNNGKEPLEKRNLTRKRGGVRKKRDERNNEKKNTKKKTQYRRGAKDQ